MYCVSLVSILLSSVHPDTSIDLWTLFSGLKRTKHGIFRENECLRSIFWIVNAFGRSLLVNYVSSVTILLFSVHPDTSMHLRTSISGQKETEISIFTEIKARCSHFDHKCCFLSFKGPKWKSTGL